MHGSDGQIEVVFRGERLVVVNKPPGLLSVPGKGAGKEDCAAARIRAWCAREGAPASGPMVVHRLDMDTSGLMVFALDAEAQRDLSGQFEARRVEKKYAALVEGIVARDEGMIEAPIRLEPGARPFRVFDRERGRPAATRWRVVSREVDRTRVEFEPRTGRTHQLRVHAALAPPEGLGHAIVGDVLYGGEGLEAFRELTGREWQRGSDARDRAPSPVIAKRDDTRSRRGRGETNSRLMLHASYLRLREPGSGKWVEVERRAEF